CLSAQRFVLNRDASASVRRRFQHVLGSILDGLEAKPTHKLIPLLLRSTWPVVPMTTCANQRPDLLTKVLVAAKTSKPIRFRVEIEQSMIVQREVLAPIIGSDAELTSAIKQDDIFVQMNRG